MDILKELLSIPHHIITLMPIGEHPLLSN